MMGVYSSKLILRKIMIMSSDPSWIVLWKIKVLVLEGETGSADA